MGYTVLLFDNRLNEPDTLNCKEIISYFTASRRTTKVRLLCERFETSRLFIGVRRFDLWGRGGWGGGGVWMIFLLRNIWWYNLFSWTDNFVRFFQHNTPWEILFKCTNLFPEVFPCKISFDLILLFSLGIIHTPLPRPPEPLKWQMTNGRPLSWLSMIVWVNVVLN